MAKHQVSGRSSDRLEFMYRIITTGIGHVHVGETAVAGLQDASRHNDSQHTKHKSSPNTYSNSIKRTVRAALSN